MFPNGLAFQEGTIQKGNEVLSINGKSLKGATHNDALAILRQAREPRQAVIVTRRPTLEATTDLNSSTDSSGSASVTSDVSIESGKFSLPGRSLVGHITFGCVRPMLAGPFLVLRTLSQLGNAHTGESAHAHKFPGSISQAHLIPRRTSLTNICVFSAAEATVCTVTLEKTSAGLGFSLEGGKGSLHGDKPLTVNRIFKGAIWVPLLASALVVGVGPGSPQASEGPTGLVGFPQPQALLGGRQTSYELDFAFSPCSPWLRHPCNPSISLGPCK